ncbi:hypothetical protein [Dactylosporangium darangshiense]|uniref:hypothetical protein n=1 Tax=Dactylosporangium darangshiense TaxID=579108 RepID=UPI00362757D3
MPVLLWSDDRATLLSTLPGERLHEQRHLDADLEPSTVQAILATLRQVATWTPPADGEYGRVEDPAVTCLARIDAELDAGLLDDADRHRLHGLLERIGAAAAFAHGDPIPTKVLLPRAAACWWTGSSAAGSCPATTWPCCTRRRRQPNPRRSHHRGDPTP